MTAVIQTEKSALMVHDLDPEKIMLLQECSEEVDDKLIFHPEIKIFGKVCRQNRSIGFFSDTSVGYRYSGQIARSQGLTPRLQTLLSYINEKFGAEFNGILINKYLSGEETIGKHSDDEKALDPQTGVICCSFGAVRKFRIRDKESGKIVMDVPTEKDKIIQMRGNFQKEFTHEIPQEKHIKEPRFSFTFRKHLE
jgi:alkylated DNA repair dioxygenase AlkB